MRLRSKLLVVTLVSVILMLAAFSTVANAEEGSYGLVTASLLNVREYPNTDCTILIQVPYGTALNIVSVENGWAQITYGDINGYVSCDYIIIRTGTAPSRSAVDRDASDKGVQIVEYAKQFLGTKYRYGGSSPSGFDCSGFTFYCYKQFGVSINRVAAAQMSNGVSVSKDNLRPGDLVFFNTRPGSGSIGHVGMYVGNGQMIHSPYTGSSIKYESIVTGTYNARYAGARRIFN